MTERLQGDCAEPLGLVPLNFTACKVLSKITCLPKIECDMTSPPTALLFETHKAVLLVLCPDLQGLRRFKATKN